MIIKCSEPSCNSDATHEFKWVASNKTESVNVCNEHFPTNLDVIKSFNISKLEW